MGEAWPCSGKAISMTSPMMDDTGPITGMTSSGN